MSVRSGCDANLIRGPTDERRDHEPSYAFGKSSDADLLREMIAHRQALNLQLTPTRFPWERHHGLVEIHQGGKPLKCAPLLKCTIAREGRRSRRSPVFGPAWRRADTCSAKAAGFIHTGELRTPSLAFPM